MSNATSAPASAAPAQGLAVGLALAATGAVAFSGKAIIVKLAYRHGVDAVTLIMLRMLFALPFFALMAWWAGRGKPPLRPRDWLAVAGLGFCGYYLSSLLDFMGLQYISASLERLILYLGPTVVLLLGWLLRGQRITRRHIVATGVSYAGMLLVFGQELHLSPNARTAWGAMLVLASTFTYALYLFYSGEVVRRLGSLRLVGWATVVACLCCIAHYLLVKGPVWTPVATPVLWLSLLNATACTAVPVLLVMMGVERLGAPLAAQVGMVGPLSTIALGVLLLGETFTPVLLAGTLLVMGGIWLFSRVPR